MYSSSDERVETSESLTTRNYRVGKEA